MAWMMSEEGKAFSRSVQRRVARADIAAGADPAAAKAAADQTTAAYTGATATD